MDPDGNVNFWGCLQAKLDKLLGDIKGVKIYIGDIMVVIKDRFPKHIDRLIIVLYNVHITGLKSIMKKSVLV